MSRVKGLFVALLFAAAASAFAPAHAGPVPANDPLPRPCVPTGTTASRAKCSFDVWGYVHDPRGFAVAGALVTDGATAVRTTRNGFFDLYERASGSHRIVVKPPGGCATAFTIAVDPVAALQNGGARHDVRLPCSPPTYNAFGFGVVQKGTLVAIARSGLQHSGQAGEIELYGIGGDGRPEAPSRLADSADDDRDAAGGLTRSGALVVFYARFDVARNVWSGIGYIRASKEGSQSGVIPAGANRAFSPYGPLVILPSGRLMQTLYGHDGRTWRIYTTFSGDDGRTWSRLIPIDVSPPFRTTEAAAVYLDGASDAASRLVLIARADGGRRPNRWWGLVQYASSDGGRTWRRQGLIKMTRTTRECMPWMHALPHGRIALVWADRGTMTLKRSLTRFDDALAMRWSQPGVVYRSAVPGSRDPDIGDFGYPSIVSFGPNDEQKAIVFNDVDPAGSTKTLTDVDLYVVPLWADPSRTPAAISP